MPATESLLVKRFDELVAEQEQIHAATLLGYGLFTPSKKEATMTLRTSTTTPNRYRYNVTIDINALPGSLDHTSSASTLQHYLGTSTVWQQAGRRNIEVAVNREILAYGREPKRVTVQGLGDQFNVVNRYGHEFACIKVGDRVVVNGTTGLHDFPSTLVQAHLDNGTWVVA